MESARSWRKTCIGFYRLIERIIMDDPAPFVEASQRLTSFFGAWPSFHDAEVIALDLWRGDICPERNIWVEPTLTAKIQVLEATQIGAHHAGKDALVSLRFHGVNNLRLDGFNHQNAINGLTMILGFHDQSRSPSVQVCFIQGHDVGSSFRCSRIEVADVEPFLQLDRFS